MYVYRCTANANLLLLFLRNGLLSFSLESMLIHKNTKRLFVRRNIFILRPYDILEWLEREKKTYQKMKLINILGLFLNRSSPYGRYFDFSKSISKKVGFLPKTFHFRIHGTLAPRTVTMTFLNFAPLKFE